MNRVQFQPGLSMPQFYERYGTEEKCQAALQAARWPNGFACPTCGRAARTSFCAVAFATGSVAAARASAA